MEISDDQDYLTMDPNSSETNDDSDYMTMNQTRQTQQGESEYKTMARRTSSKRGAAYLPKDSVHIIYEDDGADIADTVDKALSNETLGIEVSKSILTDKNRRMFNKFTVNIIIMTPDFLRAIKEHGDEHFTDMFKGAGKSILMIPKQSDMEECREVLSNKYTMSSRWPVTHIGTSGISFKRSILDVLELMEQRNSAPMLRLCRIIPSTISSVRETVHVVFRSDVPEHVTVTFLNEDGPDITMDTTRINASMFSFTPKGIRHGHQKIEVKVGESCAGVCSLTIKSPMETFSDFIADIVSPVSFMCDAMGVSERKKETLDTDFVDRFTNGQRSDPIDHLVTGNYSHEDCQSRIGKLYPTLLHFAAHYGLSGLCQQLLTYPGADIAKRLRNRDGRTPYDLAKQSDERFVADLLTDNDGTVRRRRSGRGQSSTDSGVFSIPIDPSDDPSSAPPLPLRERPPSEQFWSHRMTAIWEDKSMLTLHDSTGSGDSYGTINDLMITHF